MAWEQLLFGVKNAVFLGEAGCGKSELAINLALALAKKGAKPVHFFDLDMTKPLFRSRDQADFLSSQGVLNLNVTYPEENPKGVAVFIDEKPVSSIKEAIRLEEGIHYLAITSENYRTEVRTFSIEHGKTTSLTVNLRDTTPELVVSAPANAKVLLDGEVFAWDKGSATIFPGEHTLKFVLADYEVTTTVTSINWKSYNMALTVDIQYTETP